MKNNFLADILTETLGSVVGGFCETVGEVSSLSFTITSGTLESPVVKQIISYVQMLAIVLLILKCTNDLVQTYFLGRSNDIDTSPSWIIMGALIGAALIWSVPSIVSFISKFGTKALSDLASLNIADLASFQPVFADADQGIIAEGGSMLIYLILFLIIIIVYAIAIVQVFGRGLELVVLSIVGPIICINAASMDRSVFNLWLKQLVSVVATQFIQMFILSMCAASMLNPQGIDLLSMLTAAAWVFLAFSAPKTIKAFIGINTGVGGSVAAVGKAVASTVRAVA